MVIFTTGSRRSIYGNYTYADLIEMAISRSSIQMLTLDEIYKWIIANVPDINERTNGEASWKNTVRHNLSHKKYFMRICVGKLNCWTVDYEEKSKESGRRRSYSMDSKQLEKTRQRISQWSTTHQRELPPISSQELLVDRGNQEIKSKFGFKRGVKKCVKKLKNALSIGEKQNMRRTHSLRSYCHSSQLRVNHTNDITLGVHTYNNLVSKNEYTTNFNRSTEVYPQVTRSANELNEHSPYSNQQLYNSNEAMIRDRSTSSSTPSDYPTDWQYFTGEQETNYLRIECNNYCSQHYSANNFHFPQNNDNDPIDEIIPSSLFLSMNLN